MRSIGLLKRLGIAMIALLIAVTGVLSAWSVSPVAAQDEETTIADEAVEAAAITPGTNAVVANGPLNQRSSPGISGSILQVLSTGTVVAVISGPTAADGYSWYYVTANAVNGYVAGQFLAEVGFIVGDDVFINSNNVNIRSGAGTNNSIVDQLDYGVIGEVIGGPTSATGYIWYQIEYETSLTGWVAGLYLSLSSTPPPSGGFGIGSWILVDDPPVNLRTGPSTSHSIVTSLQSNYAAKVTSAPTSAGGYTWYAVDTLGGPSGYVAGDFFEGGFYSDDYAVVVDGPLNLRSAPSTGSSILTTMPDGASVYITTASPQFASGHTWFNVTYNGTTGWASGAYLGAD